MSYQQAAAAAARAMGQAVATRAGADLAPSPSLARDEIALGIALGARTQVTQWMATIARDAVVDTDATDALLIAASSAAVRSPYAEQKGLGPSYKLGHVAAAADLAIATLSHPQVAWRSGLTSGAQAAEQDPRVALWREVGRQAAVASSLYERSGGAASTPQRWAALSDLAALASMLPAIDVDLRAAALAHHAIEPDVLAALDRAVAAGPALRAAAAAAEAKIAGYRVDPYATSTPTQARQEITVATPADLPRAQQRLAALVRDARHLAPDALVRVTILQQRLAITAAALLSPLEDARAPLARRAQTTLAHTTPQRAQLLTSMASVHPSDPAPIAQAEQIAVQLQRLRTAAPDQQRAAAHPLGLAVQTAPAVLGALVTSGRRSLEVGSWLHHTPERAGIAGQPWQVASASQAVPLLNRLEIAQHSLSTAATLGASFPSGARDVVPARLAAAEEMGVRPAILSTAAAAERPDLGR